MFATGLAIYAVIYIAARFVPFLIPTDRVSQLVLGSACALSWVLMAVSLVQAATQYLP